MNTFKDNIIQKIKEDEVRMKPRWHFILRSLLFVVGLIIVALVATYLLSFVFFILHRTGLWFTPGFGMHGLMFFVVSSPWLLITMVVLFSILLYVLVQHYAFSYRKPLVYSMVGVVLFVIAVASLIGQTTMHERVRVFLEERPVPGFAPLYRVGNERPHGLFVGTITQVRDDGFMLTTDTGETIMVHVSERTKRPPHATYEAGGHVLIFGERSDGTVSALGIRMVDEQFLAPEPRVRGAFKVYQAPHATPTW